MPSGSSVTQISQFRRARPENRPRKNVRSSRRQIAATKISADQWCTCRTSSPPRMSKLIASTDWNARLIEIPSSSRYEPRYTTGAIDAWKYGSSSAPVTSATANEYPAIRPNAAAQRSSGSRRNAPQTSRGGPAASRFAAGLVIFPPGMSRMNVSVAVGYTSSDSTDSPPVTGGGRFTGRIPAGPVSVTDSGAWLSELVTKQKGGNSHGGRCAWSYRRERRTDRGGRRGLRRAARRLAPGGEAARQSRDRAGTGRPARLPPGDDRAASGRRRYPGRRR